MDLVVLIVSGIIGLAILYYVILAAVRTALFEHYKVVRWYEATGEWLPLVKHWKQAPAEFGSLPKRTEKPL